MKKFFSLLTVTMLVMAALTFGCIVNAAQPDDIPDIQQTAYDYYDDGYYEEDYEDQYYDDRTRNYGRVEDDYEDAPRITRGDSGNAAGFFADCKTPGDIKRRYHDLCKVYHPDSGNGSAELFYRIKEEYDKLRV